VGDNKGNKNRGRPFGYRLSEASKRAISESKKGQKHKQETRDKISKSLLIYFRKLNPLSEEIRNIYCRNEDGEIENEDLNAWVDTIKDELDSYDDVMTSKSMRNYTKIELNSSKDIEYYSHNITPELLLLFKEYCKEAGLTLEQAIDEL